MSHKNTSKQLKYKVQQHFLKHSSEEEIHDWSDSEQSEVPEEN